MSPISLFYCYARTIYFFRLTSHLNVTTTTTSSHFTSHSLSLYSLSFSFSTTFLFLSTSSYISFSFSLYMCSSTTLKVIHVYVCVCVFSWTCTKSLYTEFRVPNVLDNIKSLFALVQNLTQYMYTCVWKGFLSGRLSYIGVFCAYLHWPSKLGSNDDDDDDDDGRKRANKVTKGLGVKHMSNCPQLFALLAFCF